MAGRDIIIGGACYHATIRAGGNINVYGKIINCNISACAADMIIHMFTNSAVKNISNILSSIADE